MAVHGRRSWAEGTSKADAVKVFGLKTMGHDANYVVHTLVPGIAQLLPAAAKRERRSNIRNADYVYYIARSHGAGYGWRSLLTSLRK